MSGKGSRSSSGGSKGSSRGAVKTPPKGNKRPTAKSKSKDNADSAAREVVRGREVEFWGIGLISSGIVFVLAMYLRMAGPLGRGIDTTFGWLLGLGRFALPVVVIGVGVAMVRRRSVEHRVRLAIGWTVVVLAILGLLHVMNGADKIVADVDAMSQAGGWFGAVIGEPLRSTLSWAGAWVVLIAIGTAGAMLVTDTTLPELIAIIRTWSAKISGPAADAARTATTNRDRGFDSVDDEVPAKKSRAKKLSIYDAADDDDLAPVKPKQSRRKSEPASASTPEFVGKPGTKNAGSDDESSTAVVGATSGVWTLPPLNLLGQTETFEVDNARVAERGRLLQQALASHGVETRLSHQTVGPTVTRFELELGTGVKVAKITSLNRDIAYSMAATDVRILAPIPGKSAVGVEVPNEVRQLVSLGDLMVSAEARAATHPLDVAVGKDIAGRAVFVNLAATPHMLIAGATGAGKSSGINSILTSLLMRSTPEQVRLILIDPKQVEMGQYARLPHLLTAPVTNPKKAANALSWAVKEMENRYDTLVEVGFRDIGGFNAAFDRGEVNDPNDEHAKKYERMPYIVVVVDELNDLMMVAARDVEESITRIAQKARAVGIHLIVATQRPSVNVITGVIKANIPARMAFAVSSLTDSRVILDQPGAEKLVGKGDMLLMPGNTNVPQRIQGSWVDEEEVRKVVAHWRRQGPEVVYVSGIEGDPSGPGSSGGGASSYGGGSSDEDDLIRAAIDVVVRSGLGSTSMLQRKLKVGFARAGRIMDELEERGIVGPAQGSKPREVLVTVEELENEG
ncbi:MAG: DNA translocase FtsK [Ilumatobacteraceae bacterium]|nr:DNA translocase FtsK [Ilumatobacteraceae bacterium]